MKILYVDFNTVGHHSVYFNEIRKIDGIESSIVLPENNEQITLKQYKIETLSRNMSFVGYLKFISKLNELVKIEKPDLVHILSGDMSIVGPRPERTEHVEKYCREIPEVKFRYKVKGGLTGYAQIYGRYNTIPYDKLRLDLIYIENYSLLMDIKLIIETVRILFSKESTEGFAELKQEN